MELAGENGMGCVTLRNTTHWMRGGTYGWMGAEAGFVFMCWTNTVPNMPPWGARQCRLGNNPLILAVPREKGPVVLDMAMSQFSYGKMETLKRDGRELPLFGGFDDRGRLSKDPAAILETQRPLPIGYWKGAGLALLLDLTAAVISGGQTSCQVGRQSEEYNISQVFMAFDPSKSGSPESTSRLIDEVIEDLRSAATVTQGEEVRYPGERLLKTREENLARGVPVDRAIWEQVLEM
jgi:3-dehydro-L-gulonate 2-dehydrogenase